MEEYPCRLADDAAHASTPGLSISSAAPHTRHRRWWWCASRALAPAVQRLAVVGADGVDLARLGERLERAVDGREADGRAAIVAVGVAEVVVPALGAT